MGRKGTRHTCKTAARAAWEEREARRQIISAVPSNDSTSVPLRCRSARAFLLAALLLTASLLPLKGSASLQPETVRVAVLKGVDAVRLEGDGFLAADDSGNPLPLSSPLTVKAEKQALSVSGKTMRRLIVSAPSPVTINGKKYRGIIDITPQEKGLLVVDELPLEEYLVGLINCEISSQWPMEAVKAQAVVARTYAVFQKDSRNGSPYHLESTVLDQVYEGCSVEDTRAARGVRETAGQVLTYNGKVIQSFFHSVCGGRTEAAENVWGMELPYLDGVECRYCLDSPRCAGSRPCR